MHVVFGAIERKAMELKITEITLNLSKNHIGEGTTDKGVQVGIFLLKIRWYCKLKKEWFFSIQILIISLLRNARRDAQITTLTQRSRPIRLIQLGVLVEGHGQTNYGRFFPRGDTRV